MTTEKSPEPAATGRGEIQIQGRNQVMGQSTSSVVDRLRYSDYSVEFRLGEREAVSKVIDGVVVRLIVEYRRVPSTKTFIVYLKRGLSIEEAARAYRCGASLPAGGWAAHRDRWHRVRAANGQLYFGQVAGYEVADPCVQLELEMLIDAERSMVSSGGVDGE